MLVSFSLENYRSYASKGILEMTPGRSRNKTEHIRDDCLSIAAIYGNNASGKSNLIHGLKTMKNLVTDRSYCGNESLKHWKENDDKTRFCIEFTVNNLMYRYELEIESKSAICKNGLNNIYIYPVTYEHLSYVNLQYEPDKNGNVIMIPILERCIEDYTHECWYKDFIHDLYQRKILISKLERYNKMELTREIELVKEINLPSPNSDILTEDLVKKRDKDNHQRRSCRNKLDTNKIDIITRSRLRKDIPSPLMTELLPNDYTILSEDATVHLENVRNWFNSSLIILDTNDIYIPNNNDSLNQISNKIKKMDLGVDYLKWRKLGLRDVKKVIDTMSIKDQLRMEEKIEESKRPNENSSFICKTNKGIFKLSFNSGKMTIDSLTPVHSDGRQNDLYSESDGTIRMIELASMLTYTEKDITFIVDEMDRRLHPLLTRNIIESYLKDRSPSKQLIFTTHETEILTTELFRKDEIWFVQKTHGYSTIKSLDTITGLNHNRRLDKLYLEGEILPGVPNLKQSYI